MFIAYEHFCKLTHCQLYALAECLQTLGNEWFSIGSIRSGKVRSIRPFQERIIDSTEEVAAFLGSRRNRIGRSLQYERIHAGELLVAWLGNLEEYLCYVDGTIPLILFLRVDLVQDN